MNLNRSLRTYQKLKLYPIADTSGLKRLALAVSPPPADSKAVRGMALVELMVAIAVASLVLGAVAMASMTASLSFSSLAN